MFFLFILDDKSVFELIDFFSKNTAYKCARRILDRSDKYCECFLLLYFDRSSPKYTDYFELVKGKKRINHIHKIFYEPVTWKKFSVCPYHE